MKIDKMINRVLFLILFLLLPHFFSVAQKIKYKDLIVLLSSKQYDKAEPFLKKYLKTNDDNPNAFLYMGIVFQEKSASMDPLTQTEMLCATIDSSVLFFDKAYQGINDRELRRNDEYYEAYMRRDLRTGKFVIKLSDVQLDIENKIQGLKKRKERIIKLKSYFEKTAREYAKANEQYNALLTNFGTEKEFFLRSDEHVVLQLKALVMVFDSTTTIFNEYKAISKELGKTGHNQVIALKAIEDIRHDGHSTADFMKDELTLWDYKTWAIRSILVIEKEIKPIMEKLVAYDVQLNKLNEKIKKDSVSVKNELTKLNEDHLFSQLRKYDADPMPISLFAMKTAELEYQSNLIQNKPLRDSTNVKLKLNAIKTEIVDLKRMDSLANALMQRNYDEEEKDYHYFLAKAFGTTSVLKSTISATLDFAKRELLKRETEWEATSQSLKWLISVSDSVPLFFESNSDLKFKPLVIEKEKFTLGLSYQDSLATGYFYTITPSRKPDVKANFPVDASIFKKRFFPLAKGLGASDVAGNTYVVLVYSTQKLNDQFPVTLVKIYRADGLAWARDFKFDFLPKEILLNNDEGMITIKTSGTDGEEKIVVVDKNGKIKN